MLDRETLIENAVQASIDAGLAVNGQHGQHGVASARHAARFMFDAIQAAQPAVTDIDALAYRFWSVHPREIDAYLVNHPMPKGYKGGGRAWFFACEMRASLKGDRDA